MWRGWRGYVYWFVLGLALGALLMMWWWDWQVGMIANELDALEREIDVLLGRELN